LATLLIRTPEGIELRASIAGAGARFAAAMIDGVLFLMAYGSTMLAVYYLVKLGVGAVGELLLGIMLGSSMLAFPIATVLCHARLRGQTPGKRLMRLRVATVEGYPAGWLALVLRAVLLPIDALLPLPIPGIVGMATIALTERRQRLGDLVAGTLVLSEVQATEAREPFPGEAWSTLEPKTLALSPGLAARLGSEDLSLLRDILTRTQLSVENKRELYVNAARHYAGRLGLGEFEDARVVLKELYLFLREQRA
jgi:uncharacterized RDD family membrane protein YckC